MTDPIKAKIQELCPDVMETWHHLGKGDVERMGDITLAVVLRAIGKITPELSTIIMKRGNIYVPKKGIGAHLLWNLEMDSWDSQSKETQEFIGSLLGITN